MFAQRLSHFDSIICTCQDPVDLILSSCLPIKAFHKKFHIEEALSCCLSREAESVACTSLDAGRGTGNSNGAVGVWDGVQATASQSSLNAAEVVILDSSAASAVNRVDSLLCTGPDIVLNESLCTLADVDTIRDVLEDVVEDVGSAEAQRWSTRVDLLPVIVDVCDVHLAGVLSGVVVGVADERCLVVVVELAVADRNPVDGVGQIEEAVVEVLAAGHVARKVDVVDPDVGGLLDADGITAVGCDLGDLEVADDDVLLRLDGESETDQF